MTDTLDHDEIKLRGNPWDKQTVLRETDKAFAAFCVYRDMEPHERTYIAAETLFRQSIGERAPDVEATGGFRAWAKKYRWKERVDAFDTYTERKRLAIQERRKARAMERHADQAAEIQEALMAPLKKYRERLLEILDGKRKDELDELTDVELIALGKATAGVVMNAAKEEREALGGHSEVTASSMKLQSRKVVLQKILGNPDLIAMMEQTNLDAAVEERKMLDAPPSNDAEDPD